MVKCCGHYVTFQEVPDEVALVLSISNCPYHCEGCHSPWLQADIGDELTEKDLDYLLKQYGDGISCVCFMGTGNDYPSLFSLIADVHKLGFKACVYSGDDTLKLIDQWAAIDGKNDPEAMSQLPDYYKYGSYQQKFGGLDRKTTNQKMLKRRDDGLYEDITSWFWREKE